jgi:hypothetical protein
MAVLTMDAPVRRGSAAVVWLDGGRALVPEEDAAGRVAVTEIKRDVQPERLYLLQVVRELGDRERLLILGTGPARLALEREYVAVYQRPERLVDVEPVTRPSPDELRARLATLLGAEAAQG